MFVYKKTEELEKLTPTELDQYKTELSAHEAELRKNEIDAEVKKQLEVAKEALKEALKTELADEVARQLIDANKGGKGANETEVVKFFKENVENFTETDKHYGANTVVKAAALMTTANVKPNVTNGFSPLFGNYIDTEVGSTPKPDLCILPLITIKNQPGTESIWHTSRVNEEGDAEFIAEGALKPLADAEWQTVKEPVKEVAVRWKFTKRLMNHAPSVVVDFAEHANQLMEQSMDDGALSGDGTGNNLEGITASGVASAFVVPTQLSEYYTFANIFDVIMAVATQVRLANFKGQLTCVLNTVWEAKMKGIKNADGDYIVPPFVSPDGTTVGSVRVVFNNKFLDTHILVGDLRKFNLVMAEDVTYDEGYENDDFSKNLVSKKLEAFMGTYIKAGDAGSIVYDAIADILTDIEVPAP
jgi:HK97 family phage major capsid protein